MRRNTLKSNRAGSKRNIRATRPRQAPSNANAGPGLNEVERDFIIKVQETAARLVGTLRRKHSSAVLASLVAHQIYDRSSGPAIAYIKRIIETPENEQIVPPRERQKMPARTGLKKKRK